MRLLLVENHLDLCLLLRHWFGEEVMVCAESVAEAWKALAAETFDAVITDYMMPEANGLDFVKELRARGLTVPTIMLTAAPVEDEARAAGVDGFLAKPFDMQELDDVIARVIVEVHGGRG